MVLLCSLGQLIYHQQSRGNIGSAGDRRMTVQYGNVFRPAKAAALKNAWSVTHCALVSAVESLPPRR
jgi:hypothetical protein